MIHRPELRRGVLIAEAPPVMPVREPLIVTTLRRYVRRRASPQLLHRLAGSAGDWRRLNATWDIDGAGWRPAVQRHTRWDRLGRSAIEQLGVRLSIAERRIALQQLAAERAAAGLALPTRARLALYFGVTAESIRTDLQALRLGDAA